MERASVPSTRSGPAQGPRVELQRRFRLANPGDVVQRMVIAYRENDLLTYASAISFQLLSALIPLVLLGLGLLGVFDLQGVWRHDVAPHVRDQVSPKAFSALDDTATTVLEKKQLLWVTFGAALAVWQVSGAVRAVMGVFNRIYEVEERRRFWTRIAVSIGLALVEVVVLLMASAVIIFGQAFAREVFGKGALVSVIGFVAQWGAAAALLLVAVAALGRFAPAKARPWRWVSLGSGLVVLAWIAMSLLFAWYLRDVADYRSIFGNLATLFVMIEYVYLAAIIFLTGIQMDSLIRDQVAARRRQYAR